jgi:uncharacterized protein (DUF4415 family)
MVFEKEIDTKEKLYKDSLTGWYKSSERSNHPHPKKKRVECSLDEDVIKWLEDKTNNDEEYQMYINYYLRKVMDTGFDKHFEEQ